MSILYFNNKYNNNIKIQSILFLMLTYVSKIDIMFKS